MTKLTKPALSLAAIVLIFGCIVLICWVFQLRLNTSSSMPLGIYSVVNKPVTVGAWVEVCLPIDIAKLGLSRNYLMGGSCMGGAEPVVKQVAAMDGDEVELQKLGVFINGRLLPHSQMLTRDTQGRLMENIPFGSYIMTLGDLWLYGNNNFKSWDSRYFGAVNDLYVVAVLKPVFLFHSLPKAV